MQWFRGGKELRAGDKYAFSASGAGAYVLEVRDAQLEDQNDYSVVLRGRKCAGHLTVEERVAAALRPLQDRSVLEREAVRLECEFDRADVEAVWLKDNVDVKYALGMDRFAKKVCGFVG